jgi:hypothetical protein
MKDSSGNNATAMIAYNKRKSYICKRLNEKVHPITVLIVEKLMF